MAMPVSGSQCACPSLAPWTENASEKGRSVVDVQTVDMQDIRNLLKSRRVVLRLLKPRTSLAGVRSLRTHSRLHVRDGVERPQIPSMTNGAS
eukprot:4785420-Amphidinium_carterae.1